MEKFVTTKEAANYLGVTPSRVDAHVVGHGCHSRPAPIVLLPVISYHLSWKTLIPFYLSAVFGYFTHLLLDGEVRF